MSQQEKYVLLLNAMLSSVFLVYVLPVDEFKGYRRPYYTYVYLGHPESCQPTIINSSAFRASRNFLDPSRTVSFASSATVPAFLDQTRRGSALEPARGLVRPA